MIKDMIQNTDPSQVKAMASGLGTVGFFGATVNADQISFWAGVAADMGVVVATIVTVVLGIQSYIKNRDKDNK